MTISGTRILLGLVYNSWLEVSIYANDFIQHPGFATGWLFSVNVTKDTVLITLRDTFYGVTYFIFLLFFGLSVDH